MSVDIVDDLHAAEDHAAVLAEALRVLVGAQGPDVIAPDRARAVQRAHQAIEDHTAYCRPSCGAADGYECDDDTCGCPCGHTDADELDSVVDDRSEFERRLP